MDPTSTLETAPLPLSQGTSMLELFFHADWVIQGIMLLLLGASVWCWALIFSKTFQLRQLKRKADAFDDTFWSGLSLDSLYERLAIQPLDPFSQVFSMAMKEWRRSFSKEALGSDTRALQQRIERVMHVTLNREMDGLEKNLSFLASVGSTAPFIGLFGTVWGIMHAFQGIAASQNTSLAVVAPGIAEALLATALGLIAAIPAVLAYNKLTSDINRYGARLDMFVQEFSTLISRQLEGNRVHDGG